ncbi:glycosyltransferase [Persicobacter psychrovividus]|uniref:Uncharacterized protein n=1 Tax=Persicobacter psychrovividus TaxID=387638 RepID=A0ABN6LB44_9BACT|nr:hypothetical protein PEPS_08840 [Persicobacter psychrovividus]
MKSKILMIPTYWPIESSPIVGSQVLEQTELMSEEYDVQVLYCMPGMGLRRFLFHIFFSFILKDKGYSFVKGLLSAKVPTFGVYYYQSNFFSDKINDYFRNRAYFFVFDKLIKGGWEPNLLHSRGYEHGGVIASLLRDKSGIPFVHTENTALLLDDYFDTNRLKVYKSVLKSAKMVTTVSHFMKRNTLMHGFLQKDNVQVINNPVDSSLFKPIKKNKTNEKFVICITGYDSYIKDFDTCFRAIRTCLSLGYINFELKVGVTYGSFENLEVIANQYGILDHCTFIKQVSRSDMPEFVNSSNVFISTSIIETFGIATLEAMFCGIPVIATKNGGIDDFAKENNSVLIDVGDYIALSDAIVAIYEERIKFDAATIVDSVIHKFDEKSFLNKMISFYGDHI